MATNAAPETQFQVVADRRPQHAAVKFYRIKDFEKLQHYKNRNPSWVKLYGEQIEDYEFQQLPDAVKFHALALTVLASRTGNKIPNDPAWVAGRIGAHEPVDLHLLFQFGYLEAWQPRAQESYQTGEQLDLPAPEDAASNVLASCYQDASKVLADCYQVASTETETEGETHTETDTSAASAGVCVPSKFSFSECLRYTEHLRAQGQEIKNPGGLAHRMQKTAYADAEIEKFLRPPAPPPRREFTDEACPVCRGTKYEEVAGKGVRPCRGCLDERGARTGRKPKAEGAGEPPTATGRSP